MQHVCVCVDVISKESTCTCIWSAEFLMSIVTLNYLCVYTCRRCFQYHYMYLYILLVLHQVSAKFGTGVLSLLDAIVTQVPRYEIGWVHVAVVM